MKDLKYPLESGFIDLKESDNNIITFTLLTRQKREKVSIKRELMPLVQYSSFRGFNSALQVLDYCYNNQITELTDKLEAEGSKLPTTLKRKRDLNTFAEFITELEKLGSDAIVKANNLAERRFLECHNATWNDLKLNAGEKINDYILLNGYLCKIIFTAPNSPIIISTVVKGQVALDIVYKHDSYKKANIENFTTKQIETLSSKTASYMNVSYKIAYAQKSVSDNKDETKEIKRAKEQEQKEILETAQENYELISLLSELLPTEKLAKYSKKANKAKTKKDLRKLRGTLKGILTKRKG